MKLPELQLLAKEHNIKGCSHRNKPELIALLDEKGLVSNELWKKRIGIEKKGKKRRDVKPKAVAS